MEQSPGIRRSMPLAMLAMGGLAMNAVVASPPAHRLDLALPANLAATADKPPAAFPSLHRQAQGAQAPIQLRGFGAADPPTRIPGRVEDMVLRFHREGLPLARLWENKSTLVSLGLNPKGKPGLWITQKTH